MPAEKKAAHSGFLPRTAIEKLSPPPSSFVAKFYIACPSRSTAAASSRALLSLGLGRSQLALRLASRLPFGLLL
eukprot:4733272-Prymnesium_polylepis.1